MAANVDAQALLELVQIAKAGMSRRYVANRGADVYEVMSRWARVAGLTLDWKAPKGARTTGAVDELDVRAGVIALAQQFRSEPASLVVVFTDATSIEVTSVLSKDASAKNACLDVPAGAIVLGRYCAASNVADTETWFVDPSDELLSKSLERWASQAKLKFVWQSDVDYPVLIKRRRVYAPDMFSALASVLSDVNKSGGQLGFAVSATELRIEPRADSEPPLNVETPTPLTVKEPVANSVSTKEKASSP